MLRVVLADDEKKVLLLMCKLIDWESLGFEIVGMASDGMHALEMIRDKQPHLLVTDIRMPGFDGIDLIRQAKQIQPGLHFIVVRICAERTKIRCRGLSAEAAQGAGDDRSSHPT